MKSRLRPRGMALPVAIFLLVIMAALGAFLTLTSGGESVRLFRQVAVSNAP